jgi:heme/copper-type cytochrome/quinol oxidase subunit 3
MRARVVGQSLAELPAAGFRAHGLWFWATLGFMGIEGTGFALACAAYVYLMGGAQQWPLEGVAPDLFWGTIQTVLMLGSLVPTFILSRAARRRQADPTRRWALVLFVLNTLTLVVRGFEFPHLNARWDHDAYGSIVWALMLLHTTHLVTDFITTAALTVFLITRPIDIERFSDVDDDCVYWVFVVACWAPIYLLVYWAPRWAA